MTNPNYELSDDQRKEFDEEQDSFTDADRAQWRGSLMTALETA
jgi:hypothetical protein